MRDVTNKIIILQVMDKDTFKDDGIGEVSYCHDINVSNFHILGSYSSGLFGQDQEAGGVEVFDKVHQAAQSKQEAKCRETEAE